MTRYDNGANLERQIKRYIEAKGCYCVRSAGSKGIYDLILIDSQKRNIRLIQVKKEKLSDRARVRLLEGMWGAISDGTYTLSHVVLDGRMHDIKRYIDKW